MMVIRASEFGSRHFVLSLALVFVVFSSITLGLSSNTSTNCAEKERQSLLEFRRSLSDESNVLSSWSNTSHRCCEWRGITCDEQTGHVTALNLSRKSFYHDIFVNLPGDLNISALLDLPFLRVLDLSYNFFEGRLNVLRRSGAPSDLHTLDLSLNDFVVPNLDWLLGLSSLRRLDLSSVDLSRVTNWPVSVSQLPSLQELFLSGSSLPNVNPSSMKLHLGNFSESLETMDLSFNDFDTSLFHFIANINTKSLVHLELTLCKLKGPIPDFMANLSALKILDLSNNKFTGGIPNSFRRLCSLESLLLNSNNFSDRFEISIENLSCSKETLKILELSDNPFSGKFPNFTAYSSLTELKIDATKVGGTLVGNFDHLSKLTTLSLSGNSLTGSVPGFTGLSSLRSLDLSQNLLNGTIAESIGLLPSLEELHLQNNFLSSEITEEHFSNLSSLQVLKLSENSLILNLSSVWTPPFQLKTAFLSGCKVGPSFPNWLFRNQSKLETLIMNNASIEDYFPIAFGNVSSALQQLDLAFNQIYGKLPSLSLFSQLYRIDLSSNQLSGALPPFPSNLHTVLLSGNMLSGTTHSLCPTSPVKLFSLDVSKNRLSGEIPDCWKNIKSIDTLNLENNRFFGKLPVSLGSTNIQLLILRNNHFSGEISSLRNATSLRHLDLGHNALSGKLPEWLGERFNKLKVLSLRSNIFSGSFPTNLCQLQSLKVLDLSRNNLSGVLPNCINNMTAMAQNLEPIYYPDPINVTWKGEETEFTKNIDFVRSFDISENHLSGEIPESITSLVSLNSLNLARNNLTGRIPANISRLENLEVLDFSFNWLFGEIPASLTNMHFLNHLNLSYNELTGKIPVGPQMHTFEASCYIGNAGLFGPPLTAESPISNATNDGIDARIHSKESSGDEYVTLGFYVSLVIGFVAGFWGICGSLLIKRSWRYAYFGFWNKFFDWFHVTTRFHTDRLLGRFTVRDSN